MKNTIKTIFNSLAIAIVASFPLLLTDCGNSSKGKTDAETVGQTSLDSAMQTGACPMHPEVTGNIGATCSKCGMKLVAVNKEKAANTNDYYMDFKAVPQVRAGEASKLSFTPSIRGKNEMIPLDIQHGKKIHLIIVSKDLSYFDHVHPELQKDGTYEIRVLASEVAYTEGKFNSETKFVKGGQYVLFADYLPGGANPQVERIELNVEGTPYSAQKYMTERLVSETDGYEVSISTADGKFFNEGSTHMTVIIKKNGMEMPADEFEDFLAAKAHIVMISEDSENYLHVHPEVVKSRLSLHTTFGKPGVFRGWLQFKTDGHVHTADFVVKVAQGEAPQHGKEAHKH